MFISLSFLADTLAEGRQNIIDSLNKRFCELFAEKKDMKAVLNCMVSKYPYRLQTLEWPKSSKETEGKSKPTATGFDFINSFKGISPFASHFEFLKMLIEAKAVADIENRNVPLQWRGYQTKVVPNHHPLKKETLRDRLLLALAGIANLTEEENTVRY